MTTAPKSKPQTQTAPFNGEAIQASFKLAGHPFPMGPIIPRPNASRPPLWPSMFIDGLNRPEVLAKILLQIYTTADGNDFSDARVGLTSHMDLAFRNFLARVHTGEGSELLCKDHVVAILTEWWKACPALPALQILVESKLKPDFSNLYAKGRDNARFGDLLFAPPYYPSVGASDASANASLTQISAVSWVEKSSCEEKNHVSKLFDENAGEWVVLTLLFIKLVHAHMAWVCVHNIGEKRSNLYYKSLLNMLSAIASQEVDSVDSGQSDLVSTAVGIWQNFRRAGVLLKVNHQDSLDPRHVDLPDCLNMDSTLWVGASLSEAKQIFAWMQPKKQAQNNSDWCDSAINNVATLAWEIASAWTDFFAAAACGLGGSNIGKTKANYKYVCENYRSTMDSLNAYLREIQTRDENGDVLRDVDQLAKYVKNSLSVDSTGDSSVLSKWVAKTVEPKVISESLIREVLDRHVDNIKKLPERFRSVPSDQPNIDVAMRALHGGWLDRASQLRLFFTSICKLLEKCQQR